MKQLVEFDFLRVMAIGYIIMIRHADDYASDIFLSGLNVNCTVISLGMLIFISGYFLSKNYPSLNQLTEVSQFIKKRFLRIYPLYIISLIMFFVVFQEMNIINFVSHVFLVNLFFGYYSLTLWFVSLICFYYLLYIVMAFKYNNRKYYRIVAVLFSILICEKIVLGVFNTSLVLYLPVFLFGINSARFDKDFIKKIESPFWIAIQVLICCVLLCLYSYWPYKLRVLFQWGFTITSIYPLLFFGKKITDLINKNKLIKNLSYSTFCMYLFHRIIFTFVLTIYQPGSNWRTVLYLYAVGVPLTYLLAYSVQRSYDYLIDRYSIFT